METQTLDDPTDDIDEADYRERAAAKLDQIAGLTNQALVEAGIEISLFFLITSGRSVIVFGTHADPPDDVWNAVSDIVSAVVRQTVGLDRSRCRSLACVMTSTAPIT
jgi:hypothetical protein